MNLKTSMEAALGIQHIHKLIDDLETIRRNERRDEKGITNEDVRLKENRVSQLKNKKSKKESQIEEIEGQLERFKSMLEENKATFQKEFGFDAEEIQQNELNEKLKTKYDAPLTKSILTSVQLFRINLHSLFSSPTLTM